MNILRPFLGMMIWTMVVWLYMYYKRLGYMRRQHIEPQAMATTRDVKAIIPPEIELPAENLANLFELPVLFYALCIYLSVTQTVDTMYISLAWLFLVGRVAHSIVHCTYNNVMHRFIFYFLSSVALWAMIVRAGFAVYSVD